MDGRDAWPRHFLQGAKFSAHDPLNSYRLEGESVVCERVTPNARSPSAPQDQALQSWTVDEFAAANVPADAKTGLQEYLREKHKS